MRTLRPTSPAPAAPVSRPALHPGEGSPTIHPDPADRTPAWWVNSPTLRGHVGRPNPVARHPTEPPAPSPRLPPDPPHGRPRHGEIRQSLEALERERRVREELRGSGCRGARRENGDDRRALCSSLPAVDWLIAVRGCDADWFGEALQDEGIGPVSPTGHPVTRRFATTNGDTSAGTASRSCSFG